jgi:hypothetical protein
MSLCAFELQLDRTHPYIVAFASAVYFATLWSFAATAFTDPGKIPQDYVSHACSSSGRSGGIVSHRN